MILIRETLERYADEGRQLYHELFEQPLHIYHADDAQRFLKRNQVDDTGACGDELIAELVRDRSKWRPASAPNGPPEKLTADIGHKVADAVGKEVGDAPLDEQFDAFSDAGHAVQAKTNSIAAKIQASNFGGPVATNVRGMGQELLQRKRAS